MTAFYALYYRYAARVSLYCPASVLLDTLLHLSSIVLIRNLPEMYSVLICIARLFCTFGDTTLLAGQYVGVGVLSNRDQGTQTIIPALGGWYMVLLDWNLLQMILTVAVAVVWNSHRCITQSCPRMPQKVL